MFAALRTVFSRWFGSSPSADAPESPPEASNLLEFRTLHSDSIGERARSSSVITGQPVPYDENLFERARVQWQFGDWASLAELDRDTLEHHPDRAKLAVLVAAGHMQQGDAEAAREFNRLAHDWGCSKKLIAQVLISGLHNSLGRAAAISGQQTRALKHFENAIAVGAPESEVRLLTQARVGEQLAQLRLPGGALQLGGGQATDSGGETSKAIPDHTPSGVIQDKDQHTILADLHRTLRPRFYLEIGVGGGQSLALANCKAIGVDPVARERLALNEQTHVVIATSDEFFATMADEWLTMPPDLVLLDGTPLVDHIVCDLLALELHAETHTLVVVPGIFPRNPELATRRRTSSVWFGDVWKLPDVLLTHRPDLRLLMLDVEPSGLLLITGLNRASHTWSALSTDISAVLQQFDPPPPDILQRPGAVSPGDPRYSKFLQSIRRTAT